VAALPRDSIAPDDVLALSDAAMYEAKRRGRNQVWVATPFEGQKNVPASEPDAEENAGAQRAARSRLTSPSAAP
jgi:hypothetical protein